ncbi:MAG: 2-C-methyl-D-erythritol 4-phosphate cytidylyltransferase [Coprobacillus sp.]
MYVYSILMIFYSRKDGIMFIKITKSKYGQYASLVESYIENGKHKHRTVTYLGLVTDEQIPYLKAAYSKNKPKLIYDNQEDK